MNIAIDIDGTITQAPDFFRTISRLVHQGGGRIIVVTSRSNRAEVAVATRRELDSYGIDLDELYILPDVPDSFMPCPHPAIKTGSHEHYLWQKVAICIEENVDVFFEDSPNVIDIFQKYAPEIQVFQPK